MIRRPTWAAALFALVAAGCAHRTGVPTEKAAPRGAALAVSYIEQTENGRVRDLAAGRAAAAALDVNSRVSLRVDADALRDALAAAGVALSPTAEARELGDRVARLTAAAAGTGRMIALADSAVAAWREARRSGDYTAFDRLHTAFAQAYLGVIAPLDSAIQLRHIAEGRTPAEARRMAGRLFDAAAEGPNRAYGYDWSMIGQLLRDEIAHLEQRLDRLAAEPAIQLSVRAYRIDGAGAAVPIALDRYNDERTGPRARYEKVSFHVPEAQRRLYAQYDSLARTVEATRSAGTAFRAAIEAEFARVRDRLDPALAAAAAAVDTAAEHLHALEGWADTDALRQWIASLRPRLQAAGGPAAAILDSLEASVASLPAELDALRALAALPGSLDGATPEQAMARILGALGTVSGAAASVGRALDARGWAERARLARRLVEAVRDADGALADALRSGPVGELESGAAALDTVARRLEAHGRDIAAWIQRVALAPAAAGAERLPEPRGNRRVPIAGNLDTSFDLQSIPGGVSEGDRIRVYYDIFREGEATSLGWVDDFVVGVYGLRSRLVAGLAFTRENGGAAWTPAPSLSWLASYRGWPTDPESGIGTPWYSHLGLGLTTLPLDHDADQAVEVGLALTAAVGDRLLGGFGANLQSSDSRWFVFFSLRLFSANGDFGLPRGSL
ncbi:MAG TPA: hypothetical protein VF212_15425 [Longimicrobiales bacterium]